MKQSEDSGSVLTAQWYSDIIKGAHLLDLVQNEICKYDEYVTQALLHTLDIREAEDIVQSTFEHMITHYDKLPVSEQSEMRNQFLLTMDDMRRANQGDKETQRTVSIDAHEQEIAEEDDILHTISRMRVREKIGSLGLTVNEQLAVFSIMLSPQKIGNILETYNVTPEDLKNGMEKLKADETLQQLSIEM